MTQTPSLAEKVNAARQQQDQGIATRSGAGTLMDLVQQPSVQHKLGLSLAKGLSIDRFVKLTVTELSQNPELLKCTPASFLLALSSCASLGLYPLKQLGHAYLVPFQNNQKAGHPFEATMILGYKGQIVLAKRSDEISDITAEVVHEKDTFDYELGTNRHLTHRPALVDDPGKKIAAYAICYYRDGTTTFWVMSAAQVESFKKRSRAADRGPWKTDEDAMWRKTAVRRLATFLPLTPEAAKAIADDEATEEGRVAEVIDLGLGQVAEVQHALEVAAEQKSDKKPPTTRGRAEAGAGRDAGVAASGAGNPASTSPPAAAEPQAAAPAETPPAPAEASAPAPTGPPPPPVVGEIRRSDHDQTPFRWNGEGWDEVTEQEAQKAQGQLPLAGKEGTE